ncbi:hypothetical protein Hanom_Chr08g00684831 [Helianthus anomalus]
MSSNADNPLTRPGPAMISSRPELVTARNGTASLEPMIGLAWSKHERFRYRAIAALTDFDPWIICVSRDSIPAASIISLFLKRSNGSN